MARKRGTCPICGKRGLAVRPSSDGELRPVAHGPRANPCPASRPGVPLPPKQRAAPPRPPGRPSKFTPERCARILQAVTLGLSMETAAQQAGIAPSTLHAWDAQGRAGEPLGPDYEIPTYPAEHPLFPHMHRVTSFAEFSEALTYAQARGEMRDVRVLDTAAQAGDWRAALEKLRIRNPSRYHPAARLKVEANVKNVDAEIPLDRLAELGECSDEELAVLERVLGKLAFGEATQGGEPAGAAAEGEGGAGGQGA